MAETEIKNWGTSKYGESPLQQYFRQVDLSLIEATQGDYYKRALMEDIATLTRLFVEDMKFRSDHFLNVVLCLSKDTEIRVAGKDKKTIEQHYKKNPTVKIPSYNFKNQKTELKKGKIIKTGQKQLYKINLKRGKSVKTTAEHRFFVKTKKGKIIEKKVKELKKGDKIIVESAHLIETREIKSIEKLPKKEETYDIIDVEDNHNYFLANGILSHNSISGAQGSGKSLSGLYLLLLLAKIFQKPIDINNVLFDPEELDKKLETSKNRESFMMDEQRVTNVGMMSKTIQDRLIDFEEQLRKSQTNLIYCAPSLRTHEHYFVLETYKIIRIQNPKCTQCKEKKCKSCDIPETERSGYPKYFLVMLKTKREPDHTLVCRGLLKIPMPNPNIVKEYDEIKDEHISRLKKKDSNMWEQMKKLRDTIWAQKKEELITQLKSGVWKENTKKQIQICIYDVKGQRHLTNEAVDLMITMLQGKAKEFITKNGLDDEEDLYGEDEVIKLLKEAKK